MIRLGPYSIGDKPVRPVEIELTRNGVDEDLSLYTSASAEVISPFGNVVDSSQVSVSLQESSVVVTWPTSTSLFTSAGTYTLQIRLHTGTGFETLGLVAVEVLDPAPYTASAWASPSDVANITGVGVDTDDIYRAQMILGSMTGASFLDWDDISSRDRYFLKVATAYQAAWMKEQPDIYSRHDVVRIGTDGNPVTSRDSLTWVLAPLARQTLTFCSWSSGGAKIWVKKIHSRFADDCGVEQRDSALWSPANYKPPVA